MMTIKHLSLFSGIESFKKAMDNLGLENELVGYSEIDKWASTALTAIHGVEENLNYGDITKIDETKVPDCDLITYGFPCQDISVAGLGKGIVEGETRSGLLHDALRIIKYKKPKYAIAENVKNLVGKKFKEDFEGLLAELESYGYNNYWQVLNAKNYGIPQNRERVFVVSIRKDVDDGKFEFPKPFDNGLRLKDLLEDEVEDKYYIDNDRTSNYSVKDISNTIPANPMSDRGQLLLEPIITASRGRNPSNPSDRTTGSHTEQRLEPNSQGIANTLTTVQKDNLVLEKIVCEQRTDEGLRFFKGGVVGALRTIDSCGDKRVLEPAILTPKRTEYGKAIRKDYESGKIQESRHNMTELQPREDGISNTLTTVQKDNLVLEPKKTYLENAIEQIVEKNNREIPDAWDLYNKNPINNGISKTLSADCGHTGTAGATAVTHNYKIRKLTPKECWRLMGFTDEDYHKARQTLEDRFYNGKDRSNSQMYKMAGNSIVVDVVEAIFKELFI